MGATRIVGSGLRVWAESWLPWFVITLVFTGIPAVVIAAVDPVSSYYGVESWWDDPLIPTPEPNGFAIAFGLIATLLLGPWELMILTRAALSSTFASPLRGGALIGGTIRGVHSVLWIFFLIFLLVIPLLFVVIGIVIALRETEAAGILLFIPLAISLYFVPRLATLMAVFVGGAARGSKAIGSAWRLSSGAWATSAGTVVLSFLIGLAIAIPSGLLIEEVFPSVTIGDAIGRAIVQSTFNAIIGPMGAAIVSVLYLELKARKGLLDQEVLRANLARFDR
jgi:hypothetical protein